MSISSISGTSPVSYTTAAKPPPPPPPAKVDSDGDHDGSRGGKGLVNLKA